MKKSLLALAVVGAFASAAQAQSSVTLYGIGEAVVEIGRSDVTNTATQSFTRNVVTGVVTNSAVTFSTVRAKPNLRVQDGNSEGMGTSRFGLRGVEDLGGGMKANFQFEAGLRIDDGCVTLGSTAGCNNGGGSSESGGAFFGRTAKMGLSGGFGSVELGRMLNPAFLVQANSWSAGSSNGLFDSGSSTAPLMGGVRSSNAIMYSTPNMGGFQGKILFGAPEAKADSITLVNGVATTTSSTKANAKIDFSLEYANGPLYLGFGYDTVKGGSSAVAAAANLSNSSTKGFTLGASYNFGVVTPYFNYTRARALGDSTVVGTSASATEGVEKAFHIGIVMPIGGMTMIAGFGSSKTTAVSASATAAGITAGASDTREKAFQIGLRYPLSKRTLIETNFGQYKVTSTGVTVATNAAAQVVGGGATASDRKVRAIAVGVRHTF